MKLKIAIQKSGRLYEDSVGLLKECGIDFNNSLNRLRTEAYNFPLEILFLRDDDIPQYVADKVADIGIVGENVVMEKQKEVKTFERLGFGKCRLSIAIPKGKKYGGIQSLQNTRIATSYTNILTDFLKKNKVTVEIHEISGSVEIAPGIGLAEAICDLVSSGSTLFTNGLKEVETVMKSEALLVGNPLLSKEEMAIVNKLLFRIQAVKKASKNKYILLNAPNKNLDKIVSMIPGMKSPTILPLAEEGWSSIHSVILEDEFWEVIENLKDAGAQGILVIPIEKMVL
jgi:ATP phosphoribosyltransferase